MQIVLDTSTLTHLLRPNRIVQRTKGKKNSKGTVLDNHIRTGKLKLGLDAGGGLIGEWKKTCGFDVVHVLVTHWQDHNGIIIFSNLSSLGSGYMKKLKQMGFNDPIDKLVLKIANVTVDRIVVSDDSDFWDPKIPGSPGNKNAVVAKYCRKKLKIEIYLLKPIIGFLNK